MYMNKSENLKALLADKLHYFLSILTKNQDDCS